MKKIKDPEAEYRKSVANACPGRVHWRLIPKVRKKEVPARKSQGETVSRSEKKQEKSCNPFETLDRIVEKNAPEEVGAFKGVQQYMEEMEADIKSMLNELDDLIRTIALCNTMRKLGIRESLMEDQKYYLDNTVKMQKSIDKFDEINFEIQAAKSHFKNIGRLTVGKEALPPQDKENIIIKMLRAPYIHYRNRCQMMAYKAEKRISRLENLEQKAAQARSILGKLSDYNMDRRNVYE